MHGQILEHVVSQLAWARTTDVAVDIGCGAGASSSALVRSGLGRQVLGVDPSAAMILEANTHVGGASFVVGKAEALPIGTGGVGLITAAGSLNFTNVQECFSEAQRVLSPEGVLVVYDFATGRRSAQSPDLESWHSEWLRRWPTPTTGVTAVLPSTFHGAPLQLIAYESLTVATTFDLNGYLDYLMTESNVSSAVKSGASMEEIRGWCEQHLRALFVEPLQVQFDSYFACLSPPR